MLTAPGDAATAVVVEKARRTPKPRRHPLEENPPPPMRVYTVDQIEAEHPGLKGRVRQWIKRADAGDPSYRWRRFVPVGAPQAPPRRVFLWFQRWNH
jgi:hypothetical protein